MYDPPQSAAPESDVKRSTLLIFCVLPLFACLTPAALQEAEHARRLGEAYLGEGNVPDAVTQYRLATKKNRWDAEGWHGLGMALFAAASHADAEEALLRSLEMDPEFSRARMNLGTLYLELGRWDDAIPLLERVLADPEYRQPARARHNLGWAHYNKGDFPTAREQYRTVLRSFPQFCPSLRDLGAVDEAEGKLEDALVRYRQAVECDPRDLRSLVSLGVTEARLDLVLDACQHLGTVEEADPFGEFRDQALEVLQMLDCAEASNG
jgi:tetratricopeptide (TPR) repeat protein